MAGYQVCNAFAYMKNGISYFNLDVLFHWILNSTRHWKSTGYITLTWSQFRLGKCQPGVWERRTHREIVGSRERTLIPNSLIFLDVVHFVLRKSAFKSTVKQDKAMFILRRVTVRQGLLTKCMLPVRIKYCLYFNIWNTT